MRKFCLINSLFIILITISACKKIRGNDFQGEYECAIISSHTVLGSQVITNIETGTVVVDGIYRKIRINHEWTVHVDSLSDTGYYTEGEMIDEKSIRFVDDTLFYLKSNSSQSGTWTKLYKGVIK